MNRLIVGLGNPGLRYAKTRHNFGFLVVKGFAKKRGWTFKKARALQGELANGLYGEEKLYLLLPMTYMNCSGVAVRKAVDDYAIDFRDGCSLMVVVDDVYLKFGKLRVRPRGSCGGHNGLESVEQHLKSPDYPRLRMGVGARDLPEEVSPRLEDYVLGKFTKPECQELDAVIERGVAVLETWLDQGIEPAMQIAGEK